MRSPAERDQRVIGSGSSRSAVHTRNCEVCNRPDIRLPVCATCQRDLGKVVFVNFRARVRLRRGTG